MDGMHAGCVESAYEQTCVNTIALKKQLSPIEYQIPSDGSLFRHSSPNVFTSFWKEHFALWDYVSPQPFQVTLAIREVSNCSSLGRSQRFEDGKMMEFDFVL